MLDRQPVVRGYCHQHDAAAQPGEYAGLRRIAGRASAIGHVHTSTVRLPLHARYLVLGAAINGNAAQRLGQRQPPRKPVGNVDGVGTGEPHRLQENPEANEPHPARPRYAKPVSGRDRLRGSPRPAAPATRPRRHQYRAGHRKTSCAPACAATRKDNHRRDSCCRTGDGCTGFECPCAHDSQWPQGCAGSTATRTPGKIGSKHHSTIPARPPPPPPLEFEYPGRAGLLPRYSNTTSVNEWRSLPHTPMACTRNST